MKKINRTNVTVNRDDLSRFVVHFTRDHEPDFFAEEDGKKTVTASQNLRSILKDHKIEARNLHCMFNKKLKKLSDAKQKEFHVVCLTEVPLNQLSLLTEEIEGRRVKLKPYGIIFHRDFIIKKKGQPAIYINGYENNHYLREAVNDAFAIWEMKGKAKKVTRLLPFVNIMSETYDFTWEREWRLLGDLTFGDNDIVAVILPDNGQASEDEKSIKEIAAYKGIPVLSPEWTHEQIVAELSIQQRKTKKLVKKRISQYKE